MYIGIQTHLILICPSPQEACCGRCFRHAYAASERSREGSSGARCNGRNGGEESRAKLGGMKW